jgi:hypothetical protein
MLEAPFSRPILLLSPPATPASSHEIISSPFEKRPSIFTGHIMPATIRRGTGLARTRDNDPGAHYTAELRTERLDEIKEYLWLAGLPSCARALHRQRLLGREILITEDSNEHLVWHKTRIFVKPLPTFLFDLDCWTQEICRTRQLYESGCGFLLSYAWLIRHESDLRIAHEKALLPNNIDWTTWTEFMDDFLAHVDLQSLSGISPRFQYGELRLSRLNKIYRMTRLNWRDFVRGYMSTSTWYGDFFSRKFAWMLAFFAFMSVALSAMQVVLAAARGGEAFSKASYGFSIASLFVAAAVAVLLLVVWVTLFVYHLVCARMNNRQVMSERRRIVNIRKDVA